jgi:hypothetical protein
LREAAALPCFKFLQLNSFSPVCNICGTLLVVAYVGKFGVGYGQVGDLKTLKLCAVVIGLDVLALISYV